MRALRVHGPRTGFSILELVFALLLFQVGLLAVVGMLLRGQEILRKSQRVVRGTLEGRMVGDSLFRAGSLERGERDETWGRVRWEPVPGGAPGLRITVLGPEDADTVAVLRLWAPSEGTAREPASEGAGS